MPTPNLILISRADEDAQVFSKIARRLDFSFCLVNEREALKTVLQAFPLSVVVWNADEADSEVPKERAASEAIQETLHKLISPSHVFALSGQPASRNSSLFARPHFFQHNLTRRYREPAPEIFARLLPAALAPFSMSLKRFFPPDTPSQLIALKRARQRPVAVQAIEQVFQRKGIKPRLASHIAQATDELLVNALFNAPHNGLGNPTRRLQRRSDDFELGKNELVRMEVIFGDSHVGICVTDQFGALERETVLGLMGKSPRSGTYTRRESQAGAGLGLYGIVEMGFSLAFVVKAGSRTDAMLLAPTGKGGGFRQFREGFQFVTYFGGLAFKKPVA